MNVKILLALLISLGLSGCSWFDRVKEIEIKEVPIKRTPLNLPNPTPVSPKHVEWVVITPENVDNVFADLKKKKFNLVLFGITDDGYENLSINMAMLRKFIIEQNAIVSAYKEYYEPEEIEEPEVRGDK